MNDAPSIRGEINNDHTFNDDIDVDSGDVHDGPLFMSTPKRQIWHRVTDDDECNSDTDSKNYDGDNDDDDDNGPLFTSTQKHKVWYRKAAGGGSGGDDDDSDGSDTDDDSDDDNSGGGLDGDADDASRQSVQSYYIGDQDEYRQFYRTDSFDLFLMNQSNLTFDDKDSGLMRETQDEFEIFVPENNHTPKAHKEDDDEEEDEHSEHDKEEAV